MERDEQKDNKRLQRVAEAYKHELSEILLMEIRNPNLTGVWITNVVFTPDLRLAKIYFNVSGGRVREEEVLSGFERSKGYLRKELSQRVRMKFTPDLKFYFDESQEINQRIDELFKKIEGQKHGEGKEN
jgi:ribosome-binding factor A